MAHAGLCVFQAVIATLPRRPVMDIDAELLEIIEAEVKVSDILLALEAKIAKRVDWVRVDTRFLGGCQVEIAIREPSKRQNQPLLFRPRHGTRRHGCSH